jgi:hypothetical protein
MKSNIDEEGHSHKRSPSAPLLSLKTASRGVDSLFLPIASKPPRFWHLVDEA